MKNVFLALLLLIPLTTTQAVASGVGTSPPSTVAPFLQQVPTGSEASKEKTKKKKKRKLRIRKKVMDTPRSF